MQENEFENVVGKMAGILLQPHDYINQRVAHSSIDQFSYDAVNKYSINKTVKLWYSINSVNNTNGINKFYCHIITHNHSVTKFTPVTIIGCNNAT